MNELNGKRIILAITGSIAAYKAAFLTRLFIKSGAQVQIIMTSSAQAFIQPITLSTLSKRKVLSEVIEADAWNNHVELGLWADAMVIAPCTANTLAKLANGHCDNMVTAVYLSARCPVFLAPAMDIDMWKHPSTKRNINLLQSYGNHLIPVGHGELASGLIGEGRMAEPSEIDAYLKHFFKGSGPLKGKRVLITAGPTYEAIDPVRFIGNRSSGKMGIALAFAAKAAGAQVTVVLGPTHLPTDDLTVIRVESAQEMFAAATQNFADMDIAILAAAVSDYRPVNVASQKIKKKDEEFVIKTVKTPDIAATLGKSKKANQKIIGFALETNDAEKNAFQKLQKKNFDFIVLNSLEDSGAGFGHDTNKIKIIHQDGSIQQFRLKSKQEVAYDIIQEVSNMYS